jgi:hypothetical protein
LLTFMAVKSGCSQSTVKAVRLFLLSPGDYGPKKTIEPSAACRR